MVCERFLDLKTAGVSSYPLLDSDIEFEDEVEIACFLVFELLIIQQLLSPFLANEWC